ncbi:phosphoglucosamine mutase-like protein [Perilla frutescens var. hirtella]|uniref:Phosphoacetylglucosamine mutase n=1 Tax=Perilla frutescens var. hirtella TaxID=608512 RepID=A0AAD4JCX4_PERFH|nr:phosphoglucosamine mutase-like protein [Perilla frutescens var. hirtella]
MNQEQQSLLLRSASCFPLPPGAKFSYGTSGFRANASLLESTVFRVGILAALRSIQTRSVIGLMITASHNEVSDNGVKLADPSGGMLTQSWEPFADSLANAPDPHSLLQLLDDFVKKENIILEASPAAEVLLGRDTRPSGETLLEATKQGITSIMGATASDMGILTTPQLHWMVRAKNKGIEATEVNYYDQILASFRCLLDYVPQGNSSKNVSDKLIVDGADGVGGEKLEKMKTRLGYLTIDVRNCGDGVLNEGVGADFVQKEKVVPRSFGPADAGMRCASLDGDADRLVYFSVLLNSNKIDLVDGDKILSLFAVFLKEQLGILNGPEDGKSNKSYQPSLGVVQTAYANGASTDYLKQLGLEVALTPTGVKYLHEKAAEYDIGIYFEANGHGTVLFSDNFLSWLEIKKQELSLKSKDQHKAALRLLAVSRLINQAVGDALSGLFLVEAILKHMGWSIHKWNELYQDLPSRQLKVKVVDRTAVITENAETKVVNPAGIQEAIDAETVIYPKGRCFIRPSGTEDVVRVYAEASTQEAADSLANSVVRLVEQYLGFGRS